MTSSLASQLQRLQTSVPSERFDGASSFLFADKQGRSVDLETIYELGCEGFEELARRDGRLERFRESLFSPQTVSLNRTSLSSDENKSISDEIEMFLSLVSPSFLHGSVHKTLEWLVRRFLIHVHDVDSVMRAILPFHETLYFSRMVVILKLKRTKWEFLEAVQRSGARLDRATLARRCATDNAAFSFVCEMPLKMVKAKSGIALVMSFFSLTVCEMLTLGTLERNTLSVLLPCLLEGLKDRAVPEFRDATRLIFLQLSLVTELAPPLLTSLCHSFLQGASSSSFDESCRFLDVVFEAQNLERVEQSIVGALMLQFSDWNRDQSLFSPDDRVVKFLRVVSKSSSSSEGCNQVEMSGIDDWLRKQTKREGAPLQLFSQSETQAAQSRTTALLLSSIDWAAVEKLFDSADSSPSPLSVNLVPLHQLPIHTVLEGCDRIADSAPKRVVNLCLEWMTNVFFPQRRREESVEIRDRLVRILLARLIFRTKTKRTNLLALKLSASLATVHPLFAGLQGVFEGVDRIFSSAIDREVDVDAINDIVLDALSGACLKDKSMPSFLFEIAVEGGSGAVAVCAILGRAVRSSKIGKLDEDIHAVVKAISLLGMKLSGQVQIPLQQKDKQSTGETKEPVWASISGHLRVPPLSVIVWMITGCFIPMGVLLRSLDVTDSVFSLSSSSPLALETIWRLFGSIQSVESIFSLSFMSENFVEGLEANGKKSVPFLVFTALQERFSAQVRVSAVKSLGFLFLSRKNPPTSAPEVVIALLAVISSCRGQLTDGQLPETACRLCTSLCSSDRVCSSVSFGVFGRAVEGFRRIQSPFDAICSALSEIVSSADGMDEKDHIIKRICNFVVKEWHCRDPLVNLLFFVRKNARESVRNAIFLSLVDAMNHGNVSERLVAFLFSDEVGALVLEDSEPFRSSWLDLLEPNDESGVGTDGVVEQKGKNHLHELVVSMISPSLCSALSADLQRQVVERLVRSDASNARRALGIAVGTVDVAVLISLLSLSAFERQEEENDDERRSLGKRKRKQQKLQPPREQGLFETISGRIFPLLEAMASTSPSFASRVSLVCAAERSGCASGALSSLFCVLRHVGALLESERHLERRAPLEQCALGCCSLAEECLEVFSSERELTNWESAVDPSVVVALVHSSSSFTTISRGLQLCGRIASVSECVPALSSSLVSLFGFMSTAMAKTTADDALLQSSIVSVISSTIPAILAANKQKPRAEQIAAFRSLFTPFATTMSNVSVVRKQAVSSGLSASIGEEFAWVFASELVKNGEAMSLSFWGVFSVAQGLNVVSDTIESWSKDENDQEKLISAIIDVFVTDHRVCDALGAIEAELEQETAALALARLVSALLSHFGSDERSVVVLNTLFLASPSHTIARCAHECFENKSSARVRGAAVLLVAELANRRALSRAILNDLCAHVTDSSERVVRQTVQLLTRITLESTERESETSVALRAVFAPIVRIVQQRNDAESSSTVVEAIRCSGALCERLGESVDCNRLLSVMSETLEAVTRGSDEARLGATIVQATWDAIAVTVSVLGRRRSVSASDVKGLVRLVCHPVFVEEVNDTIEDIVSSVARSSAAAIVKGCFSAYRAFSSHPRSLLRMFGVLMTTLRNGPPEALSTYHEKVFHFLLHVLTFREENARSSHEVVSSVEDAAVDVMIVLVLKLSEAQFLPLFVESVDWAFEASEEEDSGKALRMCRTLVFARMCGRLAGSLQALFAPFFAQCISHLVAIMKERWPVSRIRRHERAGDNYVVHFVRLRAVLEMFTIVFENFPVSTPVVTASFEALNDALRFQLGNFASLKPRKAGEDTGEIGDTSMQNDMKLIWDMWDEYSERSESFLVPFVAKLVSCCRDIDQWKIVNRTLCDVMRKSEWQVRMAGLRGINAMYEALGEELLVLLPETIPTLVERLEDEEETVEAYARQVVRLIEKNLGESLETYLQ